MGHLGKRRPDHDFDDSSSEEDYQSLDEDDMYHVYLIEKLDKIVSDKYQNFRSGAIRITCIALVPSLYLTITLISNL